MPWNNKGGSQGPWGGRGPSSPQPPNLEDILRRGQDRLREVLPGGNHKGKLLGLVAVVLVGVWLLSGFYRVQADQQGVVLRFGEWVKTTQPGLNYHLPAPIESVVTPSVTRVNRIEIGFRSGAEIGRAGPLRGVGEESLMLTGDENIVDVNFTVFWRIKDAGMYLFNIRRPEPTVKAAAESAMREVIGQTQIALALAEGRKDIEERSFRLLQQILDSYGSGIEITQMRLQKVDPPSAVIDAFRDVQRAEADQERARNEAESYRNDIIPRARGEAERLIQEAEAYRQQIVAKAQGEADRFTSILAAYRNAPDVTAKRLYLETMEDVLSGVEKVIIDSGSSGTPGVVPYLPLPELRKKSGQSQGGGK